ncbi:unannotated protein [freshwater metagenome]|uniref:Unannotated protein n=1 Tax=freshwater metagenome TaxID=449393 RepID=A0A6J7H4F9_9ZZZZ|nr:hypothetical protein [Actinomycetota bacterium]
MKVLRISVVLVLLASIFNSIPAHALNPCFSEFSDSEWTQPADWGKTIGFSSQFYGTSIRQPEQVEKIIRENSKDYVLRRGAETSLNGAEWKPITVNFGSSSLLPLFPGDEFRTFISYEGRNCTKRIVFSNSIAVEEATPVEVKTYVSSISVNFQQEQELFAIMGSSFPIIVNSNVVLGENEFERAALSTPLLQQLSRRIFLLFDTKCVTTVSGDAFVNFVRPGAHPVAGRAPDFLKPGNCEAKLFDGYWQVSVGNRSLPVISSQPLFLGKVIFKVTDPNHLTKKSLSIICKKGKETKNVTGKNPKCPKGFKQK